MYDISSCLTQHIFVDLLRLQQKIAIFMLKLTSMTLKDRSMVIHLRTNGATIRLPGGGGAGFFVEQIFRPWV